ncbi:response regulator [Ponticaulis koreensis]|uniref:response regulator n=1 Tax=Ponticaulis koreensis TaxID=1123045 RepID=UPI0003B711E9|nr:response regulator [Ponticaulis koreensis]
MTGSVLSPARIPREFVPEEVRILMLEDSIHSRSVMMEVLRGIGIQNDHVMSRNALEFLQEENYSFPADIVLIIHSQENPVDLSLIQKLRRLPNPMLSERPFIYLSAIATMTNIRGARDAGADEFVMRPVSSSQLQKKFRAVIEAPQVFVSTNKYIGPCRRRQEDLEPPRRRTEDGRKNKEEGRPEAAGAEELKFAVNELLNSDFAPAPMRQSMTDRVRAIATRTMQQSIEQGDTALHQTATAVRFYLDGIEGKEDPEAHVLEISIHALTQLSVLPDTDVEARKSVGTLMTVAVQKKLAAYQKRRRQVSRTPAITQKRQSG